MTIAAHMPSAEAVLQSVVKHRRSAFSVGVTGALAEFHWLLPDDAVLERCSEALTRVTARGAFDFTVPEDVRPVAVCRPSSRSERCFREVLFCLPTRSAGMAGHRVLRDLGLDEGAIQPGQRGHRLFDLGLGICPCRRMRTHRRLDANRRAARPLWPGATRGGARRGGRAQATQPAPSVSFAARADRGLPGNRLLRPRRIHSPRTPTPICCHTCLAAAGSPPASPQDTFAP